MKKDFVMPIAVLSVICLVISGALAVTNAFTAPEIARAAETRASEARLELLPGASGFTALDTEALGGGITEAYAADNGAGYIFTAAANGYGGAGSLKIMAAVGPDGRIISTKTLSNTETRGLGSRVSEPGFEGQFNGVSSLDGFQAITGATISSNAYRDAVRAALDAYALITEKGAE